VGFEPLLYYGWPTFPSVLWCCWLGLFTCKTVSRITYTVLVEMLNPAQSNPIQKFGPFPSPQKMVAQYIQICNFMTIANISWTLQIAIIPATCILKLVNFDPHIENWELPGILVPPGNESSLGKFHIQGGPNKWTPNALHITFVKYWPILKILSPLQSPENLQCSGH